MLLEARPHRRQLCKSNIPGIVNMQKCYRRFVVFELLQDHFSFAMSLKFTTIEISKNWKTITTLLILANCKLIPIIIKMVTLENKNYHKTESPLVQKRTS